MTKNTENLVLEILRRLQSDMADIKGRMMNFEVRMTAIEHQIASLVVNQPVHSDRFDRLERRVERIERRLELHD